VSSSFQTPCRLAGSSPDRLLAMSSNDRIENAVPPARNPLPGRWFSPAPAAGRSADRRFVAPQVEGYPAKQTAMVGEMIGQNRFKPAAADFGQVLIAARGGIGGDVLEILKTRGRDQQHCGRVGFLDDDGVAVGADATAVATTRTRDSKASPSAWTRPARLSVFESRARVRELVCGLSMRSVKPICPAGRRSIASRSPDPGGWRRPRAGTSRPGAITHARHGGIQVQFPPVIRGLLSPANRRWRSPKG